MFCSISGIACVEPVVSKTGHIFERKLAEAYIDEEGKCPITLQPLLKEELYSVKVVDPNVPIAPRVASATSVPSLLKSLQSSFDATMLELHSLKMDHAKIQKELSQALYQYDAACRVVARLVKQTQVLNGEISQLKEYGLTHPLEHPMQVDETSVEVPSAQPSSPKPSESAHLLPKELEMSINDACETLCKTRKKRKTPETATTEQVCLLSSTKKVETSYAGNSILRLVQPEPHVITHYAVAGKTRGIAVYDYESEKFLGNLPVKQTRVTHLEVLVHHAQQPVFVVGKKDAVVVTRLDQVLADLEHRTVLDVTVHPSGKCFAVLESEGFTLYTEQCESLYFIPIESPFSLQFHPDGILIAAACETLPIYSVVTSKLAATFDTQNSSLFRFSENGYHLAAIPSSNAHQVAIWDLRKNSITITLEMEEPVLHLVFDYTGFFMACVHSNSISIYALAHKQWSLATTLHSTKAISSVTWGPHAKSLWVASNELKYLQCFEIVAEKE